MKKKFCEIDSEQCHNNWVFLKKLKIAECKNIKTVKEYYCQFNVILNKLIAEKTLDLFTQILWFLHSLFKDFCQWTI